MYSLLCAGGVTREVSSMTGVIYGRMPRVVGLVRRNTKSCTETGSVQHVYSLISRLLTSAAYPVTLSYP